MIAELTGQIRSLRPAVRSMVLLYWIYTLTGYLGGLFVQVYLYQKFGSLPLNILATVLYYGGIALGFCVFGYIAGVWRFNIKYGFFMSFVALCPMLVLLLYSSTMAMAAAVLCLSGVGSGLFWVTIHTFELSQTSNEERDFYSSLLSAGAEVLSVVGPALGTFLVWISGHILGWGDFTLLFLTTPLVFALGFFCFSNIEEYRPVPVRWDDIKHFFLNRRNQWSQLYLLGTGFENVASTVIPVLVALSILGGALQFGIFNTVFALFSAACLLVVARYRNTGNRLAILGTASVVVIAAVIVLAHGFNTASLIAYAVVAGILVPIMGVSTHVIDLQTMESIGRDGVDFYPTMLFRDFSLWVWRSVGGVLLLLLAGLFTTPQAALSAGLYFFAFSIALVYIGARVLLQKLKLPR